MARDWDLLGDELAAEAIGRGEPTAWFDRLYAAGVAGEVSMPWDRTDPQPLFREWAEREELDGAGRRSVVVGCGLGADAAYLAGRGFESTGFDISGTAIDEARRRLGDVDVDLRVADLLALPDEWVGRFDLVVEIFTVQALPDPPRTDAIGAISRLVAPGGTLLAIAFRNDGTRSPDQGPPFSLTRETMERLAGSELRVVAIEDLAGPYWRAEFRRD
jgi:SAM-dependent methyltransferase